MWELHTLGGYVLLLLLVLVLVLVGAGEWRIPPLPQCSVCWGKPRPRAGPGGNCRMQHVRHGIRTA